MLPIPFLIAFVVFTALTGFLVAVRARERGLSPARVRTVVAEAAAIAVLCLGVVWLSAARFQAAQAQVEVDDFGLRPGAAAMAYLTTALATVWQALSVADQLLVLALSALALGLMWHIKRSLRASEG